MSSEKNKNRKFQAALLLAMLVLFGIVFNRKWLWNDAKSLIPTSAPDIKRASSPWNQIHADSSLCFVKNGDLVLRSGSDAISTLFRKRNTKDQSYSHAGLVFIENGCAMVYNCIGTATNPFQVIQRDSLSAYISPAENTGFAIYRFSLKQNLVEKLHEVVVQYYKEARKFDPYFDLKTDSLLYCTEFVYKALSQATGKKGYFPLTQINDFQYVAVDNLYARKDMKLVCKIGYKQ